ncbi:MAG TPA: hypothetical protein VHO90_20525 [Bacteroidales bacterium]|nr:hypothetical protein [Bacteroidales bacterium]
MKNLLKTNVFLAAVTLAVAAIFSACEGPAGAPGNDGKDGTAGIDANETCKKCHNSSSSLMAKSLQLNHSLHITGEAWLEGTRNSCAPCHTSAGFLDVIANNTPKNKYNASAAALTDPTPLGCRSCHKIHTAFDSTDYNFTTVAAIDMLIDTTKTLTLDFGAGSSSNLCAKCHQPRIVKQMDFNGTPAGTYAAITSYRWGTHYGTQGAIAGGKGAFEFNGTEPYNNSDHKAGASCASCHAAAAAGISGGHTFSVVNEETGALNTNGCVKCHTSGTSALTTKINNVKTEIDGLLTQLGDKLAAYLEKENGVYTGYVDLYDASANSNARYKNPNSGNVAFPAVDNKTAAAIANFQLVLRDGSHGVHNYPYTRALLMNTIAALP